MHISRKFWVGSVACLLTLLAPSAPALACDLAAPPGLLIEANPRDQTPPSTPTVTARLKRGHGSNQGDCSGNGFVVLQVTATDDLSVGADIGYVVESDDGELFGEGSPLRVDTNGRVELLYSSKDSGNDDLSLTLRVFSVDKAGNMSREPATVTVRSDGDGCRLAGQGGQGVLWTAAGLLALVWRRRRSVARGAG